MARIVFARPVAKGAFPVVNGVQLTLLWQQNGVQMRNVFHFSQSVAGPLSPTAPSSVLSALQGAAATPAWLAFVHPTCSFLGVGVKDLRQINMPLMTAFATTALPGTSTGNPLSQATAMAVTLRSAFSGRGFVGRVFLGGLADTALSTARTFTTGTGSSTAAGVAFCQAVQSSAQPFLGSMAIYQRQLLASPVAGAPAPYNTPRTANVLNLVTQINAASDLVNNQRRRIGR